MFYELIRKKRNEWLQSADCTVRPLLQYIERRGMMRDAQIDAIRTYLYLKIACKGKPLHRLFVEGYFNDTETSTEELTVETRHVLETNKAALALFQYSCLKDKNGRQLAPELEMFIRHHATEIDYEHTLLDIFYGVTYTDYLFSLPMGAGKTFLMAAFIYIDLYFAQNEPDNPVWAHNFLILAPSALKSSIIPSLKNIREFDPSWIFSEAEAQKLRRLIQFEVLDEQKSASKSNAVRNPNAQKINTHLYGREVMGIVALTNAEKVILDRMEASAGDEGAFSREEIKKIEIANELRSVIGRIPHLAVFIDEVHHATDGDIKLRKVVTDWATASHSFCNVLGFSGTPYLDKAEKTVIGGSFTIKNTNISNVVYYYPLMEGIDNFLKRPEVKHVDVSSEEIVQSGVREFLNKYKDTVYADGTCAKLAVYCGQIATLEDTIYPLVAQIVTEYGLNPAETVLRRHKGNKEHPEPEGSEAAFASLSSSLSKVRIVLLAQIGKEGWDCKSLTGVILPHEKACPNNMVLQTTCRCLRQVVRGEQETALVWLNKTNADKLNRELKQQQNITLSDFCSKPPADVKRIERFARKEVPAICFYQIRVQYRTVVKESQPDTAARLADPALLCKADKALITIQDMEGKVTGYDEMLTADTEHNSFCWWLRLIVRESFGTLSMAKLMEHEVQLRDIYDKTNGNDEYAHQRIRSMIRQAFVPKRSFTIVEEVVPDEASILSLEHVKPFDVTDMSLVYPKEEDVKQILDWDAHPEKGELQPKDMKMIESMKQIPGIPQEAVEAAMAGLKLQLPKDPHPERLQTYQYLPYRFDSSLELEYFTNALLAVMKDRRLEYYFNGDDMLTEFKIRTYRKTASGHWMYDGLYVPDFLMLSRTPEGDIDRICIIETKGEGYAPKFKDRLRFMEETFVPKNNEQYGRKRFCFLYLKDTDGHEERVKKTIEMINEFFN